MSKISDSKIEEIAEKYIKDCGDYWYNERAIPERDIEDFVREIEKEILGTPQKLDVPVELGGRGVLDTPQIK